MVQTLISGMVALAVTAMLCFTSLRAWRGWLDIRRAEVERRQAPFDNHGEEVGLRIELSAVKERLKRLEAIASGVDP